jgi:type VI secretion system protein ImpG
MHDELLDLYNQELTYLRRMGAEFARRYPGVASALQLDATRSADPHVERLLEGFAFLTARVQLRIRDDFPEIAQALLTSVYPEYTRPIPSMSLVQFQLDPEQGKLSTGFAVPAGTPLYTRRAVDGVRCQFRTCFDTTLWPIQVSAASLVSPQQLKPPVRGTDATVALRLLLTTPADIPFSGLGIESLRLYINAESNIAATLYELLLNSCDSILLRQPGPRAIPDIVLPAASLVPVGFELDEGVLPVPRRSHLGLRLLTEYFAFPEKFFFLDLHGLDRSAAVAGSALEVVFLISRFELAERRAQLEAAVTADTLRIGCTPVANLFPHTSEPIRLTQRRPEYPIIADARRQKATGIYSVEQVKAVVEGQVQTVGFRPLYSYRHAAKSDNGLFWHATRRPRHWRADEESDVFLSFVDAGAVATSPDYDSVTVQLLCYNGDLPSRLSVGGPDGDFDLPGGGPIRTVAALVNPTPLVPAAASGPLLWRLVSLLSLNYVSLVDEGPATLQELLTLHNVRGSPAGMKQIEALIALGSAPVYSRIRGEHGLAFARGHRIDVEFDEEQFAGGGVYLFASVLERFFGMYTSLNSFTVLRARTTKRREILKEWPPRSGSKPLL